MPTAIQVAGAAFTAPQLPPLPDTPSMTCWSYFGTDLAHSQNVGPAGAYSASEGIMPTFGANYMRTVNRAGSLQLPVGTIKNPTIMLAYRYNTGTLGAAAPIFNSVTSGIPLLAYVPGAQQLTMFSGVGSPTQLNLNVTGNIWRFIAYTLPDGAPMTIYNLTDNTSLAQTTGGTVTTSANPQTLGSNNVAAGSNNQSSDFAFFAHFNTVLSKPTIDQIYAHVKAVLAQRPGGGIIV